MTKFFLFLFFFISSSVFAQHNIRGSITDDKGQPMPFASMYIPDMQKGVIADIDGKFSVENVPEGKHSVRFSFIGYTTVNKEIEVKERDVFIQAILQEESVSLEELVILPKGMDFPHYIMSQLEKNIKPLKKRISSYDGTTTATLTKQIDLSTLKKRKTIRFALMMMSWAKIFDIMCKYPDLSITMQENTQFRKGSMKTSPLKVIRCTPKITDSEMKSVMKKDWFIDKNPYDEFYDLVEKKIKELKSKKNRKVLKYKGSYEENGHTVLIVEYDKTHIEVVDGLWQIRRIKYHSNTRTMSFDFQEVRRNLFLPVAGHAEYRLDYDGYPHGKVNLAMGMSYRNLK